MAARVYDVLQKMVNFIQPSEIGLWKPYQKFTAQKRFKSMRASSRLHAGPPPIIRFALKGNSWFAPVALLSVNEFLNEAKRDITPCHKGSERSDLRILRKVGKLVFAVYSLCLRDGHGIRDAIRIPSRRVHPAEKKTSGKLRILLPPWSVCTAELSDKAKLKMRQSCMNTLDFLGNTMNFFVRWYSIWFIYRIYFRCISLVYCFFVYFKSDTIKKNVIF